MFISVTLLCGSGKRLSAYAIKAQRPAIGWLHYEECDYAGVQQSRVRARLVDAEGRELLALDHARLVVSRGQAGALIEGVEYRRKGTKHSISDLQRWWCEAPPREKPLLDDQARILAAKATWQRQVDAGWGMA
jgi:hypothetical protein